LERSAIAYRRTIAMPRRSWKAAESIRLIRRFPSSGTASRVHAFFIRRRAVFALVSKEAAHAVDPRP
jgi:hypothetical protein